jgi:hypothetical protein
MMVLAKQRVISNFFVVMAKECNGFAAQADAG